MSSDDANTTLTSVDWKKLTRAAREPADADEDVVSEAEAGPSSCWINDGTVLLAAFDLGHREAVERLATLFAGEPPKKKARPTLAPKSVVVRALGSPRPGKIDLHCAALAPADVEKIAAALEELDLEAPLPGDTGSLEQYFDENVSGGDESLEEFVEGTVLGLREFYAKAAKGHHGVHVRWHANA